MRVRALSIFFLFACLMGCALRPEHCWVCQREIHSRVRATLTLTDGKQVPACCPRCALHYREEPGNKVRRIQVTDYSTGETLPLDRVYLVEGSDETPCLHHPPVVDESHSPMQVCYDRCMPSLIAFKKSGEARAFLDEHGGEIHAPGTFRMPPAASR